MVTKRAVACERCLLPRDAHDGFSFRSIFWDIGRAEVEFTATVLRP
jgi:hypothetical protein